MPSHRDTARQFPWDRVPTTAGLYALQAIAAGPGFTVLGTYTVPAGRKASVDSMTLGHLVTVAGAAGTFVVSQIVTAGTAPVALLHSVLTYAGPVGTAANVAGGQAGWLQPGEAITAQHYQSAAGIVTEVAAGFKVTECLA